MLTPSYLFNVSDEVFELYSGLSDDILKDIARRIVKENYLTPTAEWQLKKMKQMGFVSDETVKLLAKTSGKSERYIRRIMKEAGVEALKYDDKIYKLAGKNPLPLSQSPALQAICLQGADDALQVIGNFTKSLSVTSSKAIGNVLDRAYLQIMSGAFSPQTSIRQAVNELASEGFYSIAYPSGRAESVESVVRRAVTTGVNQSTAKLTLARMDEMECDLVETSSHAGARPSHAVWQGQVFSRSGKTKGYDDFEASTGYGTGEGLCGWNCYHSFFPYYEGISTRSFSSDPASDFTDLTNEEMYEDSQKQRRYERAVRESKKECLVLDTAYKNASDGELKQQLKGDYERASYKLKQREKRLADFTESKGRTRMREREQTAGFGRSAASKASWGAKRYSKTK